MKVQLTEGQLIKMVREAILNEYDPDERYDYDYDDGPYTTIELSMEEISEAIAENYSDTGEYTPEDKKEGSEFLQRHGVDTTNPEDIKEFLTELIDAYLMRNGYGDGFSVEVTNDKYHNVEDYGGLEDAINGLCESYPFIFDDEEFILQDIISELLK